MAEHSSESADDLARLIADARQARPDATAEARIATNVGRVVGSAAMQARPGGRVLAVSAAKLTVVAAALAGALLWALRPTPTPSVPMSPTAVPMPPQPPGESPPAEAVLPKPVTATPHPTAVSRPHRVSPQANTDDAHAVAQSAVAQTSEWQLIRQAREALGSDPQASLRLTGEHARLYPQGVLAQEREVIAVDALVRLGRRDDAKVRAEILLRRFPQTAHRAHIEALLARPTP